MEYIYYCHKCKCVYSTEEDNRDDFPCKACGRSMIPTHLTAEEWKTKTDAEKNKIKEELGANGVQRELQTYESAQTSTNANAYGKALHVVGLIYILLSILGAIFLMSENVAFGFVAGVFGCLGGLLLLGFGEVINLLQDIKNK